MYDTTVQSFSTTTSTLFIFLLLFRLLKLRTKKAQIEPGHHCHAKLVIASALLVTQSLTLIVVASQSSQPDLELLPAVISFVACVGLCPLLILEHARSIRPADLAVLYLLASLACDVVEFGTASRRLVISTPTLLFAASFSLKVALVVTESRGKKAILQGHNDQLAPEQLAGVLNRTFFWWINSVLALGNRNILNDDNLPPIDPQFSSKRLRRQVLQTWDQRARPEKSTTLLKVLARSMLPHFLAPIIPRLFLIIFRYAQPVLISTAIRSIGGQSSETGYIVIAMAVVVYVGLATSKTLYQHRLSKLKIMVRGAVVGLIHNKSMSQQSSSYDDGKAVTLMSTDAENVGQAASMFHETWAQIIEVLLGMTMLAQEVGWVFPVPLVIIFFCSRMSQYLARNLQGKQKDWNAATQKRIAITTAMLASIKSLKMVGFTTDIESMILNLRLEELQMAKRVRWMMVAYNASANALGIFSPIITFVIFAVVAYFHGSALDTETAFTTTALLGLVTHPANMIMSIVPQAIGSLAAFGRIQQYLLQPSRHDHRLLVKKADNESSESLPAILVKDVTVQPISPATPTISDVNFVMARGSIFICSGSVGSGKTILSKCLLGELPVASGTISVTSRRVAYCEQVPWLPSGTLKQAICSFSPEEPSWYEQVVRLCCLDEDLLALPNGNDTLIGSRGSNLSGGQRQRVALARAVYARSDIVFLDDSFSALDNKTETRVAANLLGPEGHFRKIGATVFLTTSSSTHSHLADGLIILEKGRVTYQGTSDGPTDDTMRTAEVHIDKMQHDSTEERPTLTPSTQGQSLKVAEAISDLSRAAGDISLYGYYITAVGIQNFLILLTCTSSYSFFITFPQYWLQRWTEAPASQTMFYIGGYLISSLLAWAATNGSMWSTHILIAPGSGASLHRRLLSTIVGAPLSYFSTTNIGSILNRFSQDMQLVDKSLPPAVLSISNQVFKLLVQVALLFSAQKLMIFTLPLCLRLLDLESQSAVYSSFLESVEGVVTLRAFGWRKQAEHANMHFLDKSQQPAYTLLCLQRWLSIVLDLMIAAIAISLITLAILVRGTTTAGQIGMALNIVLVANTTLLGLVTSWTNMEISLGAISRLKSLERDTPKEDKLYEDLIPMESWPSSGVVEFDNVTVAYNDKALALQNVTMTVPAGQQLIICGRTGSGKSTLLLALLRLLDTQSGTIKVDGIDLSLVPRSLIRQKCFITIAQDPLVFSQASIRFNLDPSASLSDGTIVEALQRTGLWAHFDPEESSSLSTQIHQILRSTISTLPQMSTGQVQLFSLARAILQLQSLTNPRDSPRISLSPVLLLDEATSSVDRETESTMRSIIREVFTEKGYSVIEITHRLNGITKEMRHGGGMVALLSKGRVVSIGGVEDVLDRGQVENC